MLQKHIKSQSQNNLFLKLIHQRSSSENNFCSHIVLQSSQGQSEGSFFFTLRLNLFDLKAKFSFSFRCDEIMSSSDKPSYSEFLVLPVVITGTSSTSKMMETSSIPYHKLTVHNVAYHLNEQVTVTTHPQVFYHKNVNPDFSIQ